MKFSLGISSFLEEISSLSHSVVFLYFFAFITEESFLISPCYSLELCLKWVYLSFSPLLFASLLFTAICKASSDNHFAFLYFFFLGISLIPVSCTLSWTSGEGNGKTLQYSCLENPMNSMKRQIDRTLACVDFLFSRWSSQPGIKPRSPALQADSLPTELWSNEPLI